MAGSGLSGRAGLHAVGIAQRSYVIERMRGFVLVKIHPSAQMRTERRRMCSEYRAILKYVLIIRNARVSDIYYKILNVLMSGRCVIGSILISEINASGRNSR